MATKLQYKQKKAKRGQYFKSGVPLGYKENWKYQGQWKESPVEYLPSGKKMWAFRFKAVKSRPARTYGSFGKGTTGRWKIVAVQDIEKIGRGKYRTDMKGFKSSVGKFKVKRPR